MRKSFVVAGAGVKFAFMKATQGYSYVDPTLSTNIHNATANGVIVGPYHFTDFDLAPTDPQDPVKQANHFLAVIKPYYDAGLYLPPVADVEGFDTLQSMGLLNQTYISTWVQSFSDTIYNSLGVRPFIYGSLSTVNRYYTPAVASSHPLWLAQWKASGLANPPTAANTPLWGKWDFWQWTDSFPVSGITSENPDGDVYGGTLDQLKSLRVGHGSSGPAGFTNISDFENGEDYFNWSPGYSGSNRNILATTTADQVTGVAHRGTGSERLVVHTDVVAPNAWNFRFLSGIGSPPANPATNLPLPATGDVGFWLKTASTGLTVKIAIDDGTAGAMEAGTVASVISDGQWHLYQWNFADPSQWDDFFNGDGQITSPTVTIDSIVFTGLADATNYLDDVAHNPTGSLVPEPAGATLLAIGMLASCFGRRCWKG